MVNTNGMTKEMIESLAFSEDEKAALAEARKRPVVFDEDCPETNPERALKFRRVNPPRSRVEKGA